MLDVALTAMYPESDQPVKYLSITYNIWSYICVLRTLLIHHEGHCTEEVESSVIFGNVVVDHVVSDGGFAETTQVLAGEEGHVADDLRIFLR